MELKGPKLSLVLIMAIMLAAMPAVLNAACASPSSARLCVAVDDHAEVWINGTYIGGFDYVNWDQPGYPTCVTISPASIIGETGNIVAVDVSNLRCCEIWASWAIDTTCADGTNHSYISSNDAGNKIYRIPNACVTTPVPPSDSNGTTWWAVSYTAATTWGPPVSDQGMIWGKQIYDPRTGLLLNPVSYNTGGNAATGDCQHMFMRQPFDMVTQTPPPVANFTITKSVLGAPVTNLGTNDKVTYVLNICNTGAAEPGFVTIDDRFDPGFGFSGFEGPNGGCGNNYNFGPNYCPNNGYFKIQYPKGFPGFTCVNVTVYVQDYWVDSNDFCQVRHNVAGVNWPASSVDISSNTVDVTMKCPGTPTLSRTVSPTLTHTLTYTVSPTLTISPTITPTPTRTRIPTWTNSPTPVPTNSTLTFTLTVTKTFTLTQTVTFTYTVTPTITNTWAMDIDLAKSEDKTQVPLGDTVMYCLTFTNNGVDPASFNLWDTIPGPMDFLYCIGGCTGPVTYTGGCPDSPGGNCRVINWAINNLQPGDSGTVCFYVQAARLSDNPFGKKNFFADLTDKFMAFIRDAYITPDRYYKRVRGPSPG